jgi:peptidase M28-like protein
MVEAYAPAKSRSKAIWSGAVSARAGFAFLAIMLFCFLAVSQLNPPSSVPLGAPQTDFSSGRAMTHLHAIALKPHPIGSPEHREVRNYLLQQLAAMGAAAETQKTSVVKEDQGPPYTAASVENVLTRVKGTAGDKAILLVSHYDSAQTSPGASDDGAGVAAMLETLRAVKASPPLTNDVIFLFTDGEEAGLLGAQAFVNEHRWAKDVAVALNFEARGNRGPAVMFETSQNNGWLIDQLSAAAPRPIANSLSYEIYRLLPNDTDMSVFKKAGYAGMNFAYINGLNHYHTQNDRIEQLDERSLQHHGSYALGLTRRLGDADLSAINRSDKVYFNFPGLGLARYSTVWALPIGAFVSLFCAAMIVLAFRRKRVTFETLSIAIGFLMAAAIAAPLAVFLLWKLIQVAHSDYNLFAQGDTYNSYLYALGFVSVTIAIVSSLYAVVERKLTNAHSASAAALMLGSLVLLLICLFLPGASYLFAWPLLASAVSFGVAALAKDPASISSVRYITVLLLAAPAILILGPMIYLLFVTLGLEWAAIPSALAAILFALLMPQLKLIAVSHRWTLPGVSAIAALAFIAAGSFTAGFDKDNPKPNSIFYAANAATGKAVWASLDRRPDEWTSQFLKGDLQTGPLSEYAPSGYSGFLRSEAPMIQVAAPEIALVSEKTTDATRILRLRITSPRQAPVMFVAVDPKVEVLNAWIDGKPVTKGGPRLMFQYLAIPQEGIELALETKPAQAVGIRAVDLSYGLPEIPDSAFSPRPAHLMPAIFPYSDSTLVSKMFSF